MKITLVKSLDHLVGSFVETNCTLCWEKATQRVRKMRRVFCICIVLYLLLRLNRSLSLLMEESKWGKQHWSRFYTGKPGKCHQQ